MIQDMIVFRIISETGIAAGIRRIEAITGIDASQNEIKNQFRSLAKKWHPDKKQSNDAEKKMAQINMAYEILSNPKRRKMYDQYFSKK